MMNETMAFEQHTITNYLLQILFDLDPVTFDLDPMTLNLGHLNTGHISDKM